MKPLLPILLPVLAAGCTPKGKNPNATEPVSSATVAQVAPQTTDVFRPTGGVVTFYDTDKVSEIFVWNKAPEGQDPCAKGGGIQYIEGGDFIVLGYDVGPSLTELANSKPDFSGIQRHEGDGVSGTSVRASLLETSGSSATLRVHFATETSVLMDDDVELTLCAPYFD